MPFPSESSGLSAANYAQIKQQFPQELRLLIDRLLAKGLRERALIYPVYAEGKGNFVVITRIPPESAEGEEEGQSTVCVSSLSRSGMKSYDGFFGPEEACNDWVEASVQRGAYKRLPAHTAETVHENLRRLLGGRHRAKEILGLW